MAEITEVEKYETSDKFEELSFGCLEKAAGYVKSKDICSIYAKSSSISAFISGVIKEGLATFWFIDPKLSPLHNHFVAFNEGDRTIYLRGEIKFDSLEKGQELSEYTMKHFRPYGLPGDSVSQYIPKWLGGYDSGDNAFNLHSSADTKEWKDALSKSYEHLKKDEKNVVRFIYVIYYKEWDIRPSEIFFNFKLYSSSDQEPDETIEGSFLNPLKTLQDAHHQERCHHHDQQQQHQDQDPMKIKKVVSKALHDKIFQPCGHDEWYMNVEEIHRLSAELKKQAASKEIPPKETTPKETPPKEATPNLKD